MKKTYFISDLHLSENRPELTALFEHFMQRLAPQAQAVYILGDLFDFWVGDDEKSPLISKVQTRIKQLTEQNIPCYFIHGNRDFLLGKKFAESCGLQLLPDYQVVNLYGVDTLICHGDTLCTDDVNYQAFRRKVHQKWRQRLFLLLPLKVRIKIADKIRRQSMDDKKMKSAEIMDVNREFVRQTFKRFKVRQMIHGHTHRQNIHQIPPHFKRIVLGDWHDDYASVLEVNEQGIYFLPQAVL